MVELVHAHLVRASPVSVCRSDALMLPDATARRTTRLCDSGCLRVCLLAAVLALPSAAMANVGTPLMWVGFLHMTVGNLVLGICEGLLLKALVRSVHAGAAVGWLILANYVSSAIGFVLFPHYSPVPFNFESALFVFWSMVVVAYLLTLLIEFPFVLLAVRREKDRLRNAVRSTLIIQSASYLVLFGAYAMGSSLSLVTKTERVPLTEMGPLPGVVVYFISNADGDAYRLDLAAAIAGGDPTTSPVLSKVGELGCVSGKGRLLALQDTSVPERLHLVVEPSYRSDVTTVVESFSRKAAPFYWRSDDPPLTLYSYHNEFSIADEGRQTWRFSHAWTQFSARNVGGDEPSQYLRWETPFSSWIVRNGIALPSDKVLFEMGRFLASSRKNHDRLMLYDPATRRLAEVARGYGAVAAIEEPSGD